MKDIDLTKCNNCRAWVRYRYDRVYEDTGRIEKATEGGEVWMRFVADEDGELVTMWEDGKICEHIMDFEIVPRAPETYRDWQVGDKVCEMEHKNACYEVIFRSGELVVFKDWNNWASNPMTCSEAFTRFGMRLVLTDIERQIIEKKKKYEPQDGDVCFVKTDAGNCFIFIKRVGKDEDCMYKYVCIDTNSRYLFPNQVSCVCDRKSIRELRPATDEEKQRLFDAMAKKGEQWNAEKKVVEKISNSPEFRAKEVVMVRDAKERWKLMAFVAIGNGAYKYEVTNGEKFSAYKQCIPYNEKTMHLLGTGEDYKEEQLCEK